MDNDINFAHLLNKKHNLTCSLINFTEMLKDKRQSDEYNEIFLANV